MAQRPAPQSGGGGCLSRWAEENGRLAGRWKAAKSSGDENLLRQTVLECHLAWDKLLQTIQGLPAAVLSLPLELAVLCNSVVFGINVRGGFTDKEEQAIHHGLVRVLDSNCPSRSGLNCSELWQRILRDVKTEEMDPSLHQLAGLQGALWLASNQLQDVKALFQLLNSSEGPASVNSCSPESDLLQLLRGWPVPDEGASPHLMAESTQNLKDVLCTAAAFQQGLQWMEEGDPSCAVGILQEAATGLCSTRVLAKIYTAIGCSYRRMDRPQAALQCWKQALQTDFLCLSALYHASVLYHQLEKTDAELEALKLLYEALDDSEQDAGSSSQLFLVRTELLLKIPSLTTIFCCHNRLEVKYLIARRYLQMERVEEAVEHYFDLLTLLQDGSYQQVFLNGLAAFPRIPEVYLETASALLQQKRYQDTLTMCEEVIDKTKHLIPERLSIDWQTAGGANEQSLTSLCGATDDHHSTNLTDIPGLSEQQRESLHCILWGSTGLLFQGQALAQLQEHKDSITHFSRCINLLLKVQFVKINVGNPDVEMATDDLPQGMKMLETLKARAFLGRGIQFLELGKEKEALMNLQLCLQVTPGHREATFFLTDVLWKLNRKSEAACFWQKFQSTATPKEGQQETAWRHMPLHLAPHCKEDIPQEEALKRKIQEYLHSNAKDT